MNKLYQKVALTGLAAVAALGIACGGDKYPQYAYNGSNWGYNQIKTGEEGSWKNSMTTLGDRSYWLELTHPDGSKVKYIDSKGEDAIIDEIEIRTPGEKMKTISRGMPGLEGVMTDGQKVYNQIRGAILQDYRLNASNNVNKKP